MCSIVSRGRVQWKQSANCSHHVHHICAADDDDGAFNYKMTNQFTCKLKKKELVIRYNDEERREEKRKDRTVESEDVYLLREKREQLITRCNLG